MKNKFMGLFFIAIGFALPFVLKMVLPTFLYASIPTVICFWVGFIFLLSPLGINNVFHPYLKWSRYAIVVNAVLTIIFTVYLHLMNYFEVFHQIGFNVLRFFSFLTNPVEFIFNIFVSRPMVQQADGAVHITFSFVRMLLTTFFSLVVYSITGAILKNIKDRKITSAISGSRGPCAR